MAARGPAFKENYVCSSFDNIQLYNLECGRLLLKNLRSMYIWVYIYIYVIYIYVTKSEKSQLPRTQQQDTLFTIK